MDKGYSLFHIHSENEMCGEISRPESICSAFGSVIDIDHNLFRMSYFARQEPVYSIALRGYHILTRY